MLSGKAIFNNDLGWREIWYWYQYIYGCNAQNFFVAQRRSFCFWLGTAEIDRDDQKYRELHERFH